MNMLRTYPRLMKDEELLVWILYKIIGIVFSRLISVSATLPVVLYMYSVTIAHLLPSAKEVVWLLHRSMTSDTGVILLNLSFLHGARWNKINKVVHENVDDSDGDDHAFFSGVKCPSLVPPVHGSLYPPSCQSTNSSYESRCSFRCDSTYVLRGKQMVTCQANRQWDMDKSPTCHKSKAFSFLLVLTKLGRGESSPFPLAFPN